MKQTENTKHLVEPSPNGDNMARRPCVNWFTLSSWSHFASWSWSRTVE